MLCKICGSELSEAEEKNLFCYRCGTKIEIDDDETETAGNFYHVEVDHANTGNIRTEAKTYRRFSLFHMIAISFLVLLFVAVGLFFALRKHAEDNNIKLHVLIEPSLDFDYITYFSEGLAVVMKGKSFQKFGYIDITGELVIECQYDSASDFKEGLAAVMKNRKWGYIDKTGEEIIPFEYQFANSFCNGLAMVRDEQKCGFINTSGETVVPFEYDDAYDFIYDITAVYKDNKWGLIDREGNIVVPPEYRWIAYPYNGFFTVYTGSKCGLMDASGNLVVDCVYDEINFNGADGLIFVKLKGKWGILELENYEPDPEANPWYGYNPYYRGRIGYY